MRKIFLLGVLSLLAFATGAQSYKADFNSTVAPLSMEASYNRAYQRAANRGVRGSGWGCRLFRCFWARRRLC